jgi:hypothetical protein
MCSIVPKVWCLCLMYRAYYELVLYVSCMKVIHSLNLVENTFSICPIYHWGVVVALQLIYAT